jgi:hypothetical protein
MPTEHDHSRRRADDVYRALDRDVFPRLGEIETKIGNLDESVNRLISDGCAQRPGDLRRTEVVEDQMERIFEKIDSFGEVLTAARVDMVAQVGVIKTDMTKQIGGIRSWVLGGCVATLIGVLGLVARLVFK